MKKPELALVGDVGGTKIIMGVASEEGVLDSEEIETPQDADEVFRKVSSLAAYFIDKHGVEVGAIGWPGPADMVDGQAVVGPFQNIEGLKAHAYNVNERLAAAEPSLRNLRVLGLNDAEAQTHEAPYVIGEDVDTEDQLITFLTQSSGIGGDSVKNGVVVSQASDTMAEYGHIPFLMPDGSYVTLEDRVSGNAIKKIDGAGQMSAKELAASDHPYADGVWVRVGSEFGRGISVLIPVLGTKHIVIGGGVSRAHPRYHKALKAELDRAVEVIPDHLVPETPEVHYVPSDLIPEMGLRGAFRAIQERYEELAA
jgi:predicted NBD/HSP70 family sugar kinase